MGKLLKGFTRGWWITASAEDVAKRKKASHHFISRGLRSQESRGYHACQELRSLITAETLSYFFLSRIIPYHWINRLICQHPVRLAAESANEWVSEASPLDCDYPCQDCCHHTQEVSAQIYCKWVTEISVRFMGWILNVLEGLSLWQAK